MHQSVYQTCLQWLEQDKNFVTGNFYFALLNKNNTFFTSHDLDEVIHEVTVNIYLDAGHRVCLSLSLKLLIKSDKMPAVEVTHTFNVRSMTISLSFCLLCMYLFLCESLFRQNTALCSVSLVKWLNRELCRGLTHYQLALLVFTASWRVDLTVFIASHLKPIHYRK